MECTLIFYLNLDIFGNSQNFSEVIIVNFSKVIILIAHKLVARTEKG